MPLLFTQRLTTASLFMDSNVQDIPQLFRYSPITQPLQNLTERAKWVVTRESVPTSLELSQ